jgi:tRNA (mo5U34)-methyltransferase
VKAEELREEIKRLGPWHIDVEVTPEVSTSPGERTPGVYRPHDSFVARMKRIYPAGLEGRSVLDCACNCGAYLFFAKEIGAGRCLGFDAREHWINQAEFLARHRQKPTDDMSFEVRNLYDLQKRGSESFDVTLFLGLFYHLHDPVTGLKIAADRTSELLVLHTKARPGYEDVALIASEESPERPLSGTEPLCWLPTGPGVLARVLKWLGFPEVRCSIWRSSRNAELDRVEVLAARTQGLFDNWDAARPPGIAGIRELVETHTAPRAGVLVMGTDERLVRRLRRNAETFPDDGGDEDGMTAELDRRVTAGARYLVIAADQFERFEQSPRFATRLAADSTLLFEGPVCRIYELSKR